MANVKVNATNVITTAEKIKNLNEKMRDGFDDVQASINTLNACWDSSASDNAIKKFNSIKTSYCDNRYKVIDNFVAFLHYQVGMGYQEAESINVSLAEQFK